MTEAFVEENQANIHSIAPNAGAIAANAAATLQILERMATPETARAFYEVMLADPTVQARPEQLECLDAIELARKNGDRRALVHMATGLGKTTVLASDVKRFMHERPDGRVLFLCHQNDILQQARERFEAIVGNDYTYGDFTGEQHDYHEVNFLFASFQAMHNWRDAFLPDEFDYIVVDESHHSKAETYEPTLEYFNPEFMLGVTATPDRHDLQDIREIFGDEIYSLPLEDALIRGLLARVEYHVITDDIAETDKLFDDEGRPHSITELNRRIFIPKRDEEIVRLIHAKAEKIEKPKRIIFCKSIEHAEEIATYFDRGAALHSKVSKIRQDEYIQRFRDNEIDTLVTVDMFNEGIDIPDANQVIFLRSTESKTVFLQQLGRGLRKVDGKDAVQVLDFVGGCDRLAMIHDIWREIAERSGHADEEMKRTWNIDIAEVHFTEVARQVLEILANIEAYSHPYRNWREADSLNYYLDLKIKLGGVAPTRKYIKSLGDNGAGPPLTTVLKPFGGRISQLKRAAGEVIEVQEEYDEDGLLDAMIEVMRIQGTPSPTDFMAAIGTDLTHQYKQMFGSYNNFVRQANLKWLEAQKNTTN